MTRQALQSSWPRGLRRSGARVMAGAAIVLVSTCTAPPDALDRIHAQKVLRVAALNNVAGCYEGADGPQGFDCELVAGLANDLGVKLELHYYDTAADVIAAVRSGAAMIGAGGISPTADARRRVDFSPPLRRVRLQLVYHADSDAPKDFGDLGDGALTVPAGSSEAEVLAASRAGWPMLRWNEAANAGADDLLSQVADGRLDYTIANSDLVAITQRYYPELRVGFTASEDQPLAWALPREGGARLRAQVADYLAGIDRAGMDRLRDRYFGHLDQLDSDELTQFAQDVRLRLPRFRPLFEAAARRYGLDWRILAAIGYQESHWQADAISTTGVRGLMMLTTETAQDMNVANRDDPGQSILGAARYYHDIMQQLPDSVAEPDRSWMALAGYNLGVGHLHDARELARTRGNNPDHWLDVHDALPLLAQPGWFHRTDYGFARGGEALAFVANIRSYYDILRWINDSTLVAAQKSRIDIVPRSPG